MTYTYLKFGLGGLALVLAIAAFALKSKRAVLIWALLCAGFGGLAAHYQVFWVTALLTMMIPWALICSGDWIDTAWRAKVGFCLFLGIGSALCLYPTYIDERFDRPDYDRSFSEEQQHEIDTRSRTGEFGFGRFLRSNIPFRLVRGLDLKGGYRIEYVVDVQEAIKDKRDRYYDDLRTMLARSYKLTDEESLPNEEQLKKLAEHVKFSKPRDDVGKITAVFTTDEDAAALTEEFMLRFDQELTLLRGSDRKNVVFDIKQDTEEAIRADAVKQAKEKILRRIDTLGLKEAAAAIRGDEIVVEVPGNDRRQFEEIKAIIKQTAKLEFKMLDDGANFFKDIADQADAGKCPTCDAEGIVFATENAAGHQGVVRYGVLRKRPGETMTQARERFKLWVETNVTVPEDRQVVFEKFFDPDEDGVVEQTGWRTYYVFGTAEVTGDMVRDAGKEADRSDGGFGKWQVNLTFTPQGADAFEKITGANIGKRFAIILDDTVESAPVIQGKIGGGSGRITMGRGSSNEQLENATKLELVLKSGALPAPIELKREQLIGPSLGADAIVQGLKGGVLGAILVFIVMVGIYSRAGLIAYVAVLFNLVLQVATLAMFGASMTLPGIAGLALTIGIAVDANVLINERIRDELRLGKSPRQAVDIGYDRAFSAILDGHVTTLISGLILLQYGDGPIRGFAVTLIVGIVASLFTGVVCTRLVFDWVVRWRKAKVLSLG